MCLLASNLTSYFSCTTETLCCSEAFIQTKLDIALELVSRMTGMNYCSAEMCLTTVGKNNSEIFLHTLTSQALQTLASVEIKKCSYQCDEWETIDLDHFESSPRKIKYCNDTFPCREIRICGTFGETMPAGVRDVVYTLAHEYIKPGSMGLLKARVTREDFEDTSKSWQQDYTLSQLRISTGFSELDVKLEAYINPFHQLGIIAISGDYDDSCKGNNRCR